jgi:hypothetical protein
MTWIEVLIAIAPSANRLIGSMYVGRYSGILSERCGSSC